MGYDCDFSMSRCALHRSHVLRSRWYSSAWAEGMGIVPYWYRALYHAMRFSVRRIRPVTSRRERCCLTVIAVAVALVMARCSLFDGSNVVHLLQWQAPRLNLDGFLISDYRLLMSEKVLRLPLPALQGAGRPAK